MCRLIFFLCVCVCVSVCVLCVVFSPSCAVVCACSKQHEWLLGFFFSFVRLFGWLLGWFVSCLVLVVADSEPPSLAWVLGERGVRLSCFAFHATLSLIISLDSFSLSFLLLLLLVYVIELASCC